VATQVRRAAASAQTALDFARKIEVGESGFTHEQARILRQSLQDTQKHVQIAWGRTHAPSDDLRRTLILADLISTTLLGAFWDHLLYPTTADMEAANRLEYHDWLRRWGANSDTIDSAVVRAMYDTVFAYPRTP
jgi:hypothetical protein